MRIRIKLPVLKKNSKFGKVKESIFNFFNNFNFDLPDLLIKGAFVFFGLATFICIYSIMKVNVEVAANNSSVNASLQDIISGLPQINFLDWIIIAGTAFLFWWFIRNIRDSSRHEFY
jgi:hypothetical protein